jgi:hypothetical protein
MSRCPLSKPWSQLAGYFAPRLVVEVSSEPFDGDRSGASAVTCLPSGATSIIFKSLARSIFDFPVIIAAAGTGPVDRFRQDVTLNGLHDVGARLKRISRWFHVQLRVGA